MVSLGSSPENGISLLALACLTRIVGTYLDKLSNHFDVSANSVFHGLCGISAREIIESADGQLDDQAKIKYNGQTFEEVLMNKFVPEWSGFRLGLDGYAGHLDPVPPAGALFSPLDVWEIVQSLFRDGLLSPLPQWIAALREDNALQFTSFDDYEENADTEDDEYDLYRNLLGGWVEKRGFKMDRSEYFDLDKKSRVLTVLLEFGLLTVKEVNCNMVHLGSPNWMTTRNAVTLLMQQTEPEAEDDLNEDELDNIISDVARRINRNMYRSSTTDVLLDHPVEEYLFMELLYRFPDFKISTQESYEVYREVSVCL